MRQEASINTRISKSTQALSRVAITLHAWAEANHQISIAVNSTQPWVVSLPYLYTFRAEGV